MKEQFVKYLSSMTLEDIQRGLTDSDCDVRLAAMTACQGREDIPPEVILQGLTDPDLSVRSAAMTALYGRKDIPLDILRQWLTCSNLIVRRAAMTACRGREDIPMDVLQQGLSDPDFLVRMVASDVCQKLKPKLRLSETEAEAADIAAVLRSSTEWEFDELAKLCELADMADEFAAADGETFEAVVFAAAEKLGVEII